MIRLVIKGHRFEASAKASSLGIPLDFKADREIPPSLGTTDPTFFKVMQHETVAECQDGFLSSVLRWFQEPTQVVKGKGYPVGTLLWYQVPEWIEDLRDEDLYQESREHEFDRNEPFDA